MTSALANLKLTYFGAPGRAESIRMALKVGDIPFEEKRIGFPEFKDLKPNTPWGSLPFVELSDGTVIAQQRAILRLVGKAAGLYPEDPIAAAKVDELCDVCEDLQSKVNAAGQGMEQAAKEAARKEAVETGNCADLMKKVDAYIAKNGTGGYSVGDKLTIADLMILATSSSIVCGMFDGIPATAFDPFKNIQAVRKTAANNSKIVPYHDELKDSFGYAPFIKARD